MAISTDFLPGKIPIFDAIHVNLAYFISVLLKYKGINNNIPNNLQRLADMSKEKEKIFYN